ncbi:MAG TPA: hypothetical protein VF631_07890 [Allosphingosinicella sp.]|jgi:hypothetical protein|uniref:hypothetical protein n=1 Tax=Allosphingosinicella sp. TaxID=2823234 RepID=UPI002F29B1F7
MKTKILLAVALGCSGAPAAADTLKKVPATLNPAKAYILVEYKLMENPLAKLPGSRKTMPLINGLIFARYDPALGDVRGLGKAKSNPLPGKQSPVEPFRNREIVRGDAARLHLIEVEPDTWVIQGFGDTSFSLGSYAFQLEPGTVTDLGVAEPATDWAEDQRAINGGDLLKMAFLGPFSKRPDVAPVRVHFRARTDRDIAVPASLPRDKLRTVAFVPNVKFGNYLGGLVNRIEGVNAQAKASEQTASTAQ